MCDAESMQDDRVVLLNLRALDTGSNQKRGQHAFAVPVPEATRSLNLRLGDYMRIWMFGPEALMSAARGRMSLGLAINGL